MRNCWSVYQLTWKSIEISEQPLLDARHPMSGRNYIMSLNRLPLIGRSRRRESSSTAAKGLSMLLTMKGSWPVIHLYRVIPSDQRSVLFFFKSRFIDYKMSHFSAVIDMRSPLMCLDNIWGAWNKWFSMTEHMRTPLPTLCNNLFPNRWSMNIFVTHLRLRNPVMLCISHHVRNSSDDSLEWFALANDEPTAAEIAQFEVQLFAANGCVICYETCSYPVAPFSWK